MSNKIEKFKTLINEKYQFKGDSVILGGAILDGEAITDAFVEVPLKTLNRHGLIAGATGTGKTKTLQIIAEQLSSQGIPSMLMDIKVDLSGIAVASDGHPKIDERHEKIGFPFEAGSSPVEFLSLSGEKGLRLRATVTEFGATLFSKILNLNDTQSGIVAVVFKYCDDNKLPLLDLDDFKKTLQYITNEGKEEVQKEYGRISSASVGAITRKILELEQQGAGLFFGEPSFDVNDLVRTQDGKGIISILRLTDIQDRPKLFSTFMLQLLAEVYATFPETGDSDKPKLILFIDEAHLVFEEASSVLLDQLEAIIKLIRSKGVGIFFITQNPADIPEDVLGQLGMKVQHALRAFTAKDRKAIRLAAQNFPETEFYEIDELLTQMGIGEAFVTVLNEKGIPTPLAHTLLRAPQSRMDVLTDTEIKNIIKTSDLYDKYSKDVDRESAHEILSAKIEAAHEEEHQEELKKQKEKGRKSRSRNRKEKSAFEEILDSRASREITRTISRELTRGLLGALGIKTTSRRRKSSWF
ncbi:MAG: helicase HerA-like domain-containing protein [Bacteroidota bacterium]